jgi:hypothetical protein
LQVFMGSGPAPAERPGMTDFGNRRILAQPRSASAASITASPVIARLGTTRAPVPDSGGMRLRFSALHYTGRQPTVVVAVAVPHWGTTMQYYAGIDV